MHDLRVTGKMCFTDRNNLASRNERDTLKVAKPGSITKRSPSPLYTPHGTKFDGYSQFPRPQV